ncbi:MAG TPA: hypothetical protein VFI17_09135 [Solirubrobacterales bacterium]|nr:hypothetical protein [Solirubrobacterales bacterium]
MGIFSHKVAAAAVSFAGILDYAESGEEERTISARVEVEQRDRLGGKEPLPMFGPLGAARLLSMMRREPHYVIPFMGLVEAVAEALTDDDLDTSTFASRATVLTDPGLLAVGAEASLAAGGSWAEDGIRTAELNSSIPVVVASLPGPVERTTTLQLHEARNGMGSVRFKFPTKSANALTTVGAWAATVDCLVRSGSREEIALPIGAGLNALTKIWESLGYPSGVSLSEGTEIEALLTDVTARHTPD